MLMTEFAKMVSNMLKLSHISSSESVTNIGVTFQSIWAQFDCLYLTGQRNRDAKRKFFKGLFQIGMQATLGGYNNEACPHLQLIWLIFDPWIDFWIYKWMICKQMSHSPASNSLLSVQVHIGLLKDATYLVNGGLKMILSFGTISNNWIDFFVVVAAIFDFSLFLNFIPRGKVSSFCHFSKTDETKSGYPESKKRIWFTDWLTE